MTAFFIHSWKRTKRQFTFLYNFLIVIFIDHAKTAIKR